MIFRHAGQLPDDSEFQEPFVQSGESGNSLDIACACASERFRADIGGEPFECFRSGERGCACSDLRRVPRGSRAEPRGQRWIRRDRPAYRGDVWMRRLSVRRCRGIRRLHL